MSILEVIVQGSTNEHKYFEIKSKVNRFLRNLIEDFFLGWSYQTYYDRLMT